MINKHFATKKVAGTIALNAHYTISTLAPFSDPLPWKQQPMRLVLLGSPPDTIPTAAPNQDRSSTSGNKTDTAAYARCNPSLRLKLICGNKRELTSQQSLPRIMK